MASDISTHRCRGCTPTLTSQPRRLVLPAWTLGLVPVPVWSFGGQSAPSCAACLRLHLLLLCNKKHEGPNR